jgi:2-octaprenyl-6-methoxyphenol hydroxylase
MEAPWGRTVAPRKLYRSRMQTMTASAAVIGAGPTGLTAALALAKSGIAVMILAPPYNAAHAANDRRTTALIGPSVELLRNLGVWDLCKDHASILTGVRMVDDLGGIFRAPEIVFTATELGLASFGANIANPVLLAALNTAAERTANIERIVTSAVTAIKPGPGTVRLNLAEGGHAEAQLVVAADGRQSIAPVAAGIALHRWAYPQAAIAANFGHTRAHEDIVNELHRRSGPLTTVPLPGQRSSLVWAEEPLEAQRLMDLDDRAFAEALEARLQGLLGEVRKVGPRALYPLCGAHTERMAARRISLVGEAAHVVPPIGAQGLNLGLRDAAALAECAAAALALGQDFGGHHMLAAYQRARGADVALRTAAIDLLNRSLLQDFLPLGLVRGAAIHAIANSSTLRRLLMQSGMGMAGPLPHLMRPNALVS